MRRLTLTRRCLVCGFRAEHCHHLYPRYRGGDDVLENLIPLCADCHRKVHARDTLTRRAVFDALSADAVAYCEGKEPFWLDRQYAA
jgi:5-methylcytosine-specific restriction endonuclease McrA